MRRAVIFLVGLLVFAPLAAGHAFNHEGRDEACDIDMDPNAHYVGDGHSHIHSVQESPGMHNHDPCKQIGMLVPEFDDVGPIDEIDIPDAVIGESIPGALPMIIGDMAVQLPVDKLVPQRNLVIRGDNSLAAHAFPGSGTPADPYIIEGYHIQNVMMIADTSACVVVRDNIIWNNAIPGPLADPSDIVDRLPELLILEAELAQARDILEAAIAAEQGLQPELDAMALELAELNTERADLRAEEADLRAREDAAAQRRADHQQAIDDAAADVDALDQQLLDNQGATDLLEADARASSSHGSQLSASVDEAEQAFAAVAQALQQLAMDFEAFQATDAPAPVSESAAAITSFADALAAHIEEEPPQDPAYQQAYEAFEADMARLQTDLAGALDARSAAEGALDAHRAAHLGILGALDASRAQGTALEGSWQDAAAALDDLLSQDPPADEALQAERADFDARWDAFQAYYKDFLAGREAVLIDHQEATAQSAAAQAVVDGLVPAYEALAASVAKYPIAFDGELFESLDALIDALIALAEDEIEEELAGRLILDWNGQCVHAYHNVIQDLRVNRNNDRTGYATGGIIEDNRIDNVGQIRHYDGIFRDNEVGDRAHLEALLDPELPQPPSERSINNDGANQGLMVNNIIYGRVDLDFHGHHHGAGFFAPESHYHGSTENVAYMHKADGSCAHHSHHRAPTLEERVGVDNVISDPQYGCLPHHNHHLRWTSVTFADNTVIDPLGMGVRFEDRNHRGDDANANSENMDELDMPHMHRSFVALEENSIIGSLLVDVFNADGVDLWSDDYSEVQLDQFGKIIGQVEHLGADIVNSHRERNDGWLDVEGNAVFLYGAGRGSAYQINDAKEINRASVIGNQGHYLPLGFEAGHGREAFLAWLDDAPARDAHATAGEIGDWGGVSAPATAVHMVRIKDASFDICGNDFLGFTVGLRATNQIRDDVLIQTCADNDFGDADPAVQVRFYTESPEAKETQPLRDVTDGTKLREPMEPVYDAIDATL